MSEADKVGNVLPDSLKRFYAQSDWQESKDKINPRWSEWYKQLCVPASTHFPVAL